MKRLVSIILALFGSWVAAEEATEVFESLSEDERIRLLAAETVVLFHRPDESGAEDRDERFVTVAKLIDGDRTTIWEVIHDKENAEDFLDGVLESRVVEESERRIVVEQRTHVGGPKGDYLYTLEHTLQPMSRADFSYVEGEIRNVIGSWWICGGPSEGAFLVIYSLHIDPGFFAPQIIVKRGMKKSMPGTIRSIEREVKRRIEAEGASD